jgi:hypothetical protein
LSINRQNLGVNCGYDMEPDGIGLEKRRLSYETPFSHGREPNGLFCRFHREKELSLDDHKQRATDGDHIPCSAVPFRKLSFED